MILVDAGPFKALFDPKDPYHTRCQAILRNVQESLVTTVPVLVEAFHLLSPASQGAIRLREFIVRGGLTVWFLDQAGLQRCLELMARYADHPMDLADASLVAAAEALRARRIFTVDRDDFSTYRIRQGHSHKSFEILD
ncbi:MAG: PIN domain-containing protein [Thermoanaerobaculia bacterium]